MSTWADIDEQDDHCLGLAGANVVATEALLALQDNLADVVAAWAMMCVHGDAGLGNTLSVNASLRALAPADTCRVQFRARPTPRDIRHVLFDALGISGTPPTRPIEFDALLKDALSERFRVVVGGCGLGLDAAARGGGYGCRQWLWPGVWACLAGSPSGCGPAGQMAPGACAATRPARAIAVARRRVIPAGPGVPFDGRRCWCASCRWLASASSWRWWSRASWVARCGLMNMAFSCLSGGRGIPALTRQAHPPGLARGRGRITPFPARPQKG